MENTVTIRKDGKHYYCTNRQHFINDYWFHHEKLEDVKNFYIKKGFKLDVQI